LNSNTIKVENEGAQRSGAVILHNLGGELFRRKTRFSMHCAQNGNVIFNPLNHEGMAIHN